MLRSTALARFTCPVRPAPPGQRPQAAEPVRRALLLAGAALAAGSLVAPTHAAGAKDPVWFGKRQMDLEEAREALPADAAAALDAWADWGLEREYVFVFDASAQVLFVTPEPKRAKQRAALLSDLTEALDELWTLDEPVDAAQFGIQEAAANAFGPRGPRDGLHPLSSQPVVVFQFAEHEHLPEVLGRLAEEHDYLRDWLPKGGALPSFTFEWPHVAGFALTPEQQEYDPDNELVHLTTECLATRRFGNLPQWLRMGLAWKMEWDLRDSIYCFPGRDEFVFEVEHAAWPADLRSSFKSRLKKSRLRPLQGSEFMAWESDSYEGESARLCFGMTSDLVEERPEAFALLLHGMRLAHEDGSLVVYPEQQRWERRLPYSIPPERQLGVMESAAGPNVLRDAEEWFAKGLK